MTDHEAPEGDDPVEAFERLRAEVAMMRRAVEGLAAERAQAAPAPNYDETLGQFARALDGINGRLDAIVTQPALAMTPDAMRQRIEAAASAARREDRDELARARNGLDRAAGQLEGYVVSARRGDEQNRWLTGAGAGGVVLGLLLWATFAGPIVRAVPESWHWREERAAQAMDMPMWQAGGQLLATADPAAYRTLIADEQIARANRDTIEGCRKAARKAGDSVKCTIRVEAASQGK